MSLEHWRGGRKGGKGYECRVGKEKEFGMGWNSSADDPLPNIFTDTNV